MDSRLFYGGSIKKTHVSTISEAKDIMQDSANPVKVVVLPPDAGDKGNQDSDLDEVLEDRETMYDPAGELEVEVLESSDDDDDDLVYKPPVKKGCKSQISWKSKNSSFKSKMQPQVPNWNEKFVEMEDSSPYAIWQKFLTQEMVDHITIQTNLYANRDKNDKRFEVTSQEIRKMIGIFIFSGYHCLPEEQHYWSTQPDLGISFIYNVMSRNRYLEIKKYMHFADNQRLQDGNKMSKVQPLFDFMNKNIVQLGLFHEQLSIDESMIPYFGRHSAKMYIKGKPIRFGYKIWCLCGTDGYPYHMQIYQGKELQTSDQPLGTRVVKNMVDIIDQNSNVRHHALFFDNFFTSYSLLSELADHKVCSTGTIRDNRTAKAVTKLATNTQMKKMDRGSYDYCSDGKIFIAKWHDNSIVSIASNWQNQVPIHKVKRRIKGGQKEVHQPHLIYAYNKGMGGVDLMDRLLESYRPTILGKKWYWPLFIHIINTSVVAAWRLYNRLGDNKMTHLEFRREVVLCLLKAEQAEQWVKERLQPYTIDDIRFDGMNHKLGTTTQGRCKICKKNTKCLCEKCKVRLHSERGKLCFKQYHSK